MQEKGSFAKVYEQYQPLLYGTLKRYSVYQYQEDLLQEARLALWEAYLKFDAGQGDFSAYAASYVRGRVLSYLTRQNKHKHSFAFSQFGAKDQEGEMEWRDPLADKSYEAMELKELLEHASCHLSAREKMILLEHVWHDRPLRDIAKQEGVSLETVKTWRKRALKKLRKSLSPFLDKKDI